MTPFYEVDKSEIVNVILGVGTLLILQNVLQFLGAFIGLSIAIISIRGYREIHSPTLLRLATAFFLLFGGLAVDSLIGFSELGLLPQIAFVVSVLISTAAFLQATGYFFLAFSHAINVRAATRYGIVASLALPLLNVPAAFHSLSLFFVLYGAAETGLAYVRLRKTETLVIAMGLCQLVVSTFLTWVAMFYPTDQMLLLLALITKVIGFSTLLIPVLQFSFLSGVRGE